MNSSSNGNLLNSNNKINLEEPFNNTFSNFYPKDREKEKDKDQDRDKDKVEAKQPSKSESKAEPPKKAEAYAATEKFSYALDKIGRAHV